MLTIYLTGLAYHLAQATELPVQLISLITLVLTTMGGTAILKRIIAAVATGGNIPKGDAAKYVTWATAYVLTFVSIAYGWTPLPSITCPDPSTCLAGVAAVGSLIAAVAGLVYDIVRKAIGPVDEAPA